MKHYIENLSKKYLKDPILIGMVGGIIIIALVYIVGSRDYTGRGIKLVSNAFEGHVPAYAFLAKILFTAVTMGTGFRGGEAYEPKSRLLNIPSGKRIDFFLQKKK